MPAQGTFNKLRILAGVFLIVSLFLPLYTMPTSWSGIIQPIHAWDVGRGDLAGLQLRDHGGQVGAEVARQELPRCIAALLIECIDVINDKMEAIDVEQDKHRAQCQDRPDELERMPRCAEEVCRICIRGR